MIWFIGIGLIYLICVYCSWMYVNISHSKGGRYASLYPDAFDVFLTFVPIYNIFFAIDYLVGSGYAEDNPERKIRIFKIEK